MKSITLPPFDANLEPQTTSRFLSNGRYHLMLTPTGSGYSQWGPLQLAAWRGDRTTDAEGFVLYLRDQDSSESWRLGAGIGGRSSPADRDGPEGCIELVHVQTDIECRMRVFIPPGEDLEVRRLSLRNLSGQRRTIQVRSLIEVVLNTAAAQAAHPVFSRLFLQTEVQPDKRLLLLRRRPRSPEEYFPILFHAVVGGQDWQFETDRSQLLGRRLPGEWPLALQRPTHAEGRVGNVLDPVLSHAVTMTIEPGTTESVDLALGIAADADVARQLSERLADRRQVDDWMAEAEAAARQRREDLGLCRREADEFETLAGGVLHGAPSLIRSANHVGRAAMTHRQDLAELDVDAGGALVVLDRTGSWPPTSESDVEATYLRMARYWAALGLPINTTILGSPAVSNATHAVPRRLTPAPRQREALRREARLVIDDEWPTISFTTNPVVPEEGIASQFKDETIPTSTRLTRDQLGFDNGFGGFSKDGREYVVRLDWIPGQGLKRPPLPWTNVVANEHFGLLVSEIGAGTTWCGNSREHRLTPWSNDPLLDPPGECFYIRDEVTGRFWSPLPGPVPLPVDHEMCHGFGYSRASLRGGGLDQVTEMFVARHDPVRFTRIRLSNHSETTRRLSLYAAYRLVLGHTPEETGRFLVTEVDEGTGALLAENRNGGDFAGRFAFASIVSRATELGRSISGDRAGFLGLRGSIAAPAALSQGGSLDGRTGSGLDPAFVQRVELEVPAGGNVEVTFLLGEAPSREEALTMLERYQRPEQVADAWDTVRRFWDEELGGVQIQTPSPALDLMVNGWLPYQTLACRIWGRTAFYQSGGAFGFRDQLQDAASLMLLRPDLTREQIIRHAAHQFVEGDVLHWWHPPTSSGIRTRFADDLLWLPLSTAQYIAATGDQSLLVEEVSWVTARSLDPGEDEAFLHPGRTGETSSVYEHCLRAIDRSLEVGEHGLPLFGTGDWNDGMNRVGRLGRGESTWMGFFLYQVLGEFLPLCQARGDSTRAARYEEHRLKLREALNDGGWDGDWYRRGYYDSGAPLGSRESDECQIDALAQAWAVLSGVAPEGRAGAVMDRVEDFLIDEPNRLIRLLTPPFQDTVEDPGYIKGYVAGVRENGGQYTHAALWVVRAMAQLGRNNRAARLLDLLNPVLHATTPEQVARYQVEPYVVAADVYSEAPHVGRGGWTWYTGSSGWMYRVALESILGLTLVGGHTLVLNPCIPDDWPGFSLRWRRPGGTTIWEIEVDNSDGDGLGIQSARHDGIPARVEAGSARIELVDDGRTHRIELKTGASRAAIPALR